MRDLLFFVCGIVFAIVASITLFVLWVIHKAGEYWW